MKLTYLITMNVTITPMLKHPMSMGTMLIIQTILLSMNMSTKSQNSWYAYILFITIIGGMMIMFMYMSSIASNEKFKFNKKLMVSTMIFMITINIPEIYDSTTEILNKMLENKLFITHQEELKSTSKFFNLNKSNLTIILMLSLLISMVAITNITNSFEGPLKKTYV